MSLPTWPTCRTNRLQHSIFDLARDHLRSEAQVHGACPGKNGPSSEPCFLPFPKSPYPWVPPYRPHRGGCFNPRSWRPLFPECARVMTTHQTGRCSIPAGTCSSSRMNPKPPLCDFTPLRLWIRLRLRPFHDAAIPSGAYVSRAAEPNYKTVGVLPGPYHRSVLRTTAGVPTASKQRRLSALCAESAFAIKSIFISVPGVAMPRHNGRNQTRPCTRAQ